MADNPFDPPLGAAGLHKKAGLTKPERISQKRSLPPPPPSAVQAAKQKSLPPPPPSSTGIDIEIDDAEDDATVIQDRPEFAGFFDADDDLPEKPRPALGSSPWSLPAVAPRAEAATAEPKLHGPSSDETGAPTIETPSDTLETRDLAKGSHSAKGGDLAQSDFAGMTEVERTQELDDADEVTVAANEKPEPLLAGAGNGASDSTAKEDDLDALFGRSRDRDSSPPGPGRPSGPLMGKAPPPPPSLKPPPVASPSVVNPSIVSKAAPPPPTSKGPPPPPRKSTPPPAPSLAVPAPAVPGPAVPAPAVPSPVLVQPSSALAQPAVLSEPALPAPFAVLPEPSEVSAPLQRPSPLPPAPLPPPPMAAGALPPLPPPPFPSAPPPPLPAPAAHSGGLSFHDDDVTAIFDRGSSDSAPPPALPQLPGGSLPLPSFAPQAAPMLTFSDPPPSLDRKFYQRPGVLGGLAAALLFGALSILLWPSSGRLVVAVAGPNGTVVDGIQVTVDDKVVCTSSPCQVEDLEAKSYLVAVTAEGFEKTAPQAVIVRAGEDAVHNVTLQAPLVVAPTGIDVPADGPGLSLTVDGKAIGNLPQKVLDLTPGEHFLRVSGGDRYQDEEKRITVSEGQVLSLQPFALKVKRGRAVIEAGSNAEDATVKLDGRTIKLPHTADLDTSSKHTLSATKEGYSDFETELVFEPGKAERTFTVSLESTDEAGDETAEEGELAQSSRSGHRSGTRGGAASSSASRGAAKGKGTLNITSTPSAMVILDGRPIGKTPRMGVKVSPGAHSIVFVSGKGRKRATTKVAAGDAKTVSVRF